MNIVPHRYMLKRVIETFSTIRYGTLHFTTPNGERHTFRGVEPGPEATFIIDDWSVMRNAASRGDIGLGEDYIAGKWQSDSIEELFKLFLLNFDELETFANGNTVNRFLFLLHNNLLNMNSKRGSSRNIKAHYDVGNEFYCLWLDKSMTYSSALFDNTQDLENAQFNKYQRIIDKNEKSNASILEVGCGWGGFAQQALDADDRYYRVPRTTRLCS